MTRDERLAAFLAHAAGESFRYGETDCAMTMARWVWHETGRDPAAALRGTYATRAGWLRIVLAAGSLEHLVAGLAGRAGLLPTASPAAGDIGVVTVPTIGPACAIRGQGRWVAKMTDGIIGAELPMLMGWRC